MSELARQYRFQYEITEGGWDAVATITVKLQKVYEHKRGKDYWARVEHESEGLGSLTKEEAMRVITRLETKLMVDNNVTVEKADAYSELVALIEGLNKQQRDARPGPMKKFYSYI